MGPVNLSSTIPLGTLRAEAEKGRVGEEAIPPVAAERADMYAGVGVGRAAGLGSDDALPEDEFGLDDVDDWSFKASRENCSCSLDLMVSIGWAIGAL